MEYLFGDRGPDIFIVKLESFTSDFIILPVLGKF